MATVLREPLVYGPQQKRPIAPVDYFSRPLTLGINPNARALELSASAPAARLAGNSDRYPNLLLSTLAAGAAPALSLPLNSGRLFDSAPRKAWQADPLTAQGFLVCPDAPIQGLDASAPQATRFLGQLQPPNLLTSTLGAAPSAPQFAIRLDAPAPQVKYQVRTESLSRPLTLGINPNAAALSITDSATSTKVAAYSFDPPNLLGTTLVPGVSQTPTFLCLCDSAPQAKPRLYQFDTPNLTGKLIQSFGMPLSALRIDWSATPRKFVAYPFDPLNRRLYIPVTVVADVVGQTQASGTTQLSSDGFLVSVVTAYSATVATGIIISQDPVSGTQAATGSTVTITVSLGPQVDHGSVRRQLLIFRLKKKVKNKQDSNDTDS